MSPYRDGEGVFVQGPNALLVLLGDASGCPLIQGNGDAGINATEGDATVRAPLGQRRLWYFRKSRRHNCTERFTDKSRQHQAAEQLD